MEIERPRRHADVNAVIGGYLRDLAFAQPSQQQFGYKRAAPAILALEVPVTELVEPGLAPQRWNVRSRSATVVQTSSAEP